ncbi:MAG TPA: sn-glycerol-3-phosphate ABC transporter substrate-binding protein UgpB [Candidatus Dormibacteraeota bacterium]|jgi:sn-glycerol 3-phosphate transport system substrate-binding protein|nr:sn-glycerol-3-phosphate ABC transporter substrate-binding protein UgpB [Candidatus Dormibacteraeota bacterium]
MSETKTSRRPAAIALLLVAGLLLVPAAPAFAKTEIQFWHAMTGQLNDAVNALVKQFNDSQTEYEVKPLQKGNYAEALTAAIAAYRQRQAPNIVQVFEVGTQTMMLSGAILPVYQLMKEQEIAMDWKDFIAPVVGYYSKDGNLYSMPFNSSTPILFYNKDEFQKAGLDPTKPPQTWKQVEEYSKKLIASGASKCGFSTGWPSWVQIENMHALHDQPFATKHNGFDGLDVELLINREFGVKHMAQLVAWQKENVFSYGGRRGDADPKFLSGECAMYMQSSSLIGGFTKGASFKWATGQLPHYGAPYKRATSIIGGATLWVMKGKPANENRGTARFLKFISDTNQQMWWHVTTGYLAISNSAVKNLEAGYHFKKNPDQYTAFAQLTKGTATPNSQGLRLGNFVQIRDVIEAEMENVFAGKKTAKQGLDDAVAKSNDLLKEFAAANKQ